MDHKATIKKILEVLTTQIGVDVEDINMEDSFLEDLHMSPADLTDFLNELNAQGFNADSVDLSQIETIESLVEKLGLESDI